MEHKHIKIDTDKKNVYYDDKAINLTKYILIGRALKPLVELNKVVNNINENNLSDRINNIKGNDEVSNLAESFNVMLDRLNKSFTKQKQFTSNAAHELKTPLAIMKSSIDVLKLDEKLSIEDYKENLKYVEESTMNLMDIVERLLKLTSRKDVIKKDKIKINKVISDVINNLNILLCEKKINVEVNIHDEEVIGDEKQLYHVFYNLIENAIKYNVYNGVINIDVLRKQDEVKVSVNDTGTGIPEEEIENIFEPFYCVDKSRSEENGGYGLGLALVKSIIEQHNGRVNVTSILSQGSTFEVVLPTAI